MHPLLPSRAIWLWNDTSYLPISWAFKNLVDIPDKFFTTTNCQKFVMTRVSNMIVEVPNRYNMSKLCLTEVLFSLEVGYTLVSIGCLDELGLSMTFAEGFCTIKGSNSKTIEWILCTLKGLYHVVHEHETANAATEMVTVMELHRWYGHITPSVACHLVENGLVSGLKFDNMKDGGTFCESCIYAKATCKPIAKIWEGKQSKEVSVLVWSDIWGPMPVETLGGKRYYITFTDDHLCLMYLCTLCQKSKMFVAYQQFEAWLDQQLAVKVHMLHSDWGGEYLGNKFIMYLKRQGMAQWLTAHNTPQHNSIAEQLNRTILKRVHALLHASSQPKFLWGEATHHIVWLKNQTPTKVLDGLTPYKVAFRWKPDLSKVWEWESVVYARTEQRNKLEWRVNLNGELNNDKAIYMCQPPSYTNPVHPCYVCWLCKTLYGLKQSSHQWCYASRQTYVEVNDTYSEGGTHEETLRPQRKAKVMNKRQVD